MPMRKKSIAPLIAVVSSVLLTACAAPGKPAPEPARPMVFDNYRTPTPAELYAERFQASAAQVMIDERVRFVRCGERCPGATPKTPVADVHAAVARALSRPRPAARPAVDSPTAKASEGRPHGANVPSGSRPERQRAADTSPM